MRRPWTDRLIDCRSPQESQSSQEDDEGRSLTQDFQGATEDVGQELDKTSGRRGNTRQLHVQGDKENDQGEAARGPEAWTGDDEDDSPETPIFTQEDEAHSWPRRIKRSPSFGRYS